MKWNAKVKIVLSGLGHFPAYFYTAQLLHLSLVCVMCFVWMFSLLHFDDQELLGNLERCAMLAAFILSFWSGRTLFRCIVWCSNDSTMQSFPVHALQLCQCWFIFGHGIIILTKRSPTFYFSVFLFQEKGSNIINCDTRLLEVNCNETQWPCSHTSRNFGYKNELCDHWPKLSSIFWKFG